MPGWGIREQEWGHCGLGGAPHFLGDGVDERAPTHPRGPASQFRACSEEGKKKVPGPGVARRNQSKPDPLPVGQCWPGLEGPLGQCG